jgi:DNA-binding beta-propeller fold protein YncE
MMDLPIKAGKIAWDGRETLYAVDGSQVYRIRDGRIERIPIDEKMESVAVAVDPAGTLWVLDGAGKQAVKIDATGAVLARPFQLNDKALNWLSKIKDIAVSSKGVVSVADSGNHWIWMQAFKPDGTRLSTVIRNDKSGSMLESPAALSFDEADNLYVLDDQARRIHIYSPTGEPMGSFSIQGKSESPVDLCVIHGEIYVADPGKDRIQVFSTQGIFLREIGIKGSGKGDFIDPVGIAVKEDLTLFVADAGNSRIQVLQQALNPGMPSEVNITPGIRSVNIEWKKNPESYPLDYKIYRSVSMEEPFNYIGSTRENRFFDQDVAGGRKYFYRVSAQAAKETKAFLPSRWLPNLQFTPHRHQKTSRP